MPKKVQIAIPKPCHENWQDMTPTQKGRLCASCQKEVHDFTKLTDREVSAMIKNNSSSCGRFLASQLERDLVIPKEKSSFWVAASAAVVSFIGLGNYEAVAQETHPTEQHETQKKEHSDNNKSVKDSKEITGIVTDIEDIPIPGVNIKNLNTSSQTQSDFDGVFSINVSEDDVLEFTYIGMETKNVTITKDNIHNHKLSDSVKIEGSTTIIGDVVIYRTFFGRIFNSIGNVFRRH